MSDLTDLLSELEDVKGVGIDIESVDRFRSRPVARIFSDSERRYCESGGDLAERFAGRWCAKEAVVKALSVFLRIGVRDVEILAGLDGKPVVNLGDAVSLQGVVVEVSISHTSEIAVAVAVARSRRPETTGSAGKRSSHPRESNFDPQ